MAVLLSLGLGFGCSKSPGAEDPDTGDSDAPGDSDASSDSGPPGDSDTGTTADLAPDQWDDLLEPVAGSRLRPVFRVAEDGTRAHIGWQDTLLGTPCEFRTTSDGALRCAPAEGSTAPWLYADANCSEPVLQDIDIPDGVLAMYALGDGCFDRTFYEIGEPVTEIYFDANGPCEFFSNDPSHRLIVLPVEELVAATVTPLDGNSRIVPLLLEADDGARAIQGAWDREHEEEVVAGLDGQGQPRWFGHRAPRVSTLYFADAACTEPVALSGCVPELEQPRTAIESDPGGCSPVLGRRELTEEVSTMYALDDGRCEPAETIGDVRSWGVGGALDDAAFAEAAVINDGGRRLRHDVFGTPEGEPFLASQLLHDLLLAETQCNWSEVPPGSGSLDCIPHGNAWLGNNYLDAACTERTASRAVFEESCYEEALFAYVGGVVAQIVDTIAGPGGYRLDETEQCVPEEVDGDSDGGEAEYFIVDEATAIEAAHAEDIVE